MEESREKIADMMSRHGFTEKEAEAAYHLERAWELFEEIYRKTHSPDPDEPRSADLEEAKRRVSRKLWEGVHRAISEHTAIHAHFGALFRWLGMGVLRRDYPEGWGRPLLFEEEE